MEFTLTEKIITGADILKIKRVLKENFEDIAQSVTSTKSKLEVRGVHNTFGSINRKDITEVKIKRMDSGFLIKCHVKYKTSFAFWIILLITIFTYLFWLIPIIMFLYHKTLVKNSLQEVLKNSKDELELIKKKK